MERRQQPEPSNLIEYLRQLPALTLLDRLPTPAVAVGPDGVLIYANPACARMLGHPESTTLSGQPLSALLAGHEYTSPPDCVAVLRTAEGAVIDWCGADGYPIRTVTSHPLLIRATDPILLITITDVTDSTWNSGSPRMPGGGRGESSADESAAPHDHSTGN
jgi:PAS domain-containing protein